MYKYGQSLAICVIVCCFCIPSYAQPNKMDLNGLEIGKVYTKQQVIDIMGEPRAYRKHDSEFGLDESYYYGERTELDFQHDGEFYFFTVQDSKYAILTLYIKGGICVGENLSVMKKVGLPMKKVKDDEYVVYINYEPLFIAVNSDNTIRRLSYVVRD